jgi:NRPS condensation-like uncharacterized protein
MMQTNNRKAAKFERRITPVERFFARSPFATVVVVARIRGNVSEPMLRKAVAKVQQRHPNLRVRIREDTDGEPWFTSEGVEEIPVQVVPREADDHWIKVAQESAQVVFPFGTRPAIRFILVQSPEISELVILCHHIICDGLSLAYLARDLMEHLGDPTREVEVLPDPEPINKDTIPEEVSLNRVVRFLINRMNKKWAAERVVFDQQDYRDLSEAYWQHYQHQMLSIELSQDQTTALVERCRREEVTVNSALSAAFVGAQCAVQVGKPHHSGIGVGTSLRDRVRRPVGEVMGLYAGAVSMEYAYDSALGFWENARRFHAKLRPLESSKNLFQHLRLWFEIDPTIIEAINFKKLGGLVPEQAPRHEKLSAFGQRDDAVLSILKRDKMESLDRIVMGTAVTNLTRMDFPHQYGTLELDRLIMKPGGAFPLANVNLVLGAVTCSGRLSLIIEYVEENIDVRAMEEIRNVAMGYLLDE